jgi:hypothetical protein
MTRHSLLVKGKFLNWRLIGDRRGIGRKGGAAVAKCGMTEAVLRKEKYLEVLQEMG